ncbi:MAG TPA: hypothetical protein V6D23_27320, partial [Candidatus Obscuribacterales bacterium]
YSVAGKGDYRLDTSSSAPADDHLVVAPTTGPGRWKLDKPSLQNTTYANGMFTAADLTALAAIPDAALSAGQLAKVPDIGIYRWASGTSLTADGRYIVNGASTGQWKLEFIPESIVETKTTHGFAVKNCIRFDGSNWVKAQGNSIAGTTGVRLVVAVPSTSTFVALARGLVVVPSHGLTLGTQYYLDPDSAGGLVASLPVGSTSRPLGYYLPVLKVISSSELLINIPPRPTHNLVYAESVASGTSSGPPFTVSFTNLSMNNIGNRLRMEGTLRNSGGASQVRLSAPTEAAGSSDYAWSSDHPANSTGAQVYAEDSAAAYLRLGVHQSTTSNVAMAFEGTLRRIIDSASTPSGFDWLYSGLYTCMATGIPVQGRAGGFINDNGTDLTRLDFTFANAQQRAGDFIRLYCDRMPDA